MVTDVEIDEEGVVTQCCIAAVMTKRNFEVDWTNLKDQSSWLYGWK